MGSFGIVGEVVVVVGVVVVVVVVVGAVPVLEPSTTISYSV